MNAGRFSGELCQEYKNVSWIWLWQWNPVWNFIVIEVCLAEIVEGKHRESGLFSGKRWRSRGLGLSHSQKGNLSGRRPGTLKHLVGPWTQRLPLCTSMYFCYAIDCLNIHKPLICHELLLQPTAFELKCLSMLWYFVLVLHFWHFSSHLTSLLITSHLHILHWVIRVLHLPYPISS